MKNQRRNRRVSCVVPVDGQDKGIFSEIITVDISKRGVGFISSCKVPVNHKIAIELELEEGDQKSVLVVGKVQWVGLHESGEGYRIGVCFDDIQRGSKSRLDNYFRKRSLSRIL